MNQAEEQNIAKGCITGTCIAVCLWIAVIAAAYNEMKGWLDGLFRGAA